MKPLIVISTGRGGSTILLKLLSKHPSLSWTSNLLNRFPERPMYNRLMMNMLDWPIVGSQVEKYIKPVEAYEYWEKNCRGFRRPFRDLRADDVTPHQLKKFREAAQAISTARKDRLLLKITGWPRIMFLKEIFPEAQFIHIYRDGRAMVNSLLQIGFWKGWEGVNQWRWGQLDEEKTQILEKYDNSFVALASLQWLILMEAVEKSKINLGVNNLLEIRYEDLCSNTLHQLDRILEYTSLPKSSVFYKKVNKIPLHNANSKWESQLSKSQQAIMNEILKDKLAYYNYKL